MRAGGALGWLLVVAVAIGLTLVLQQCDPAPDVVQVADPTVVLFAPNLTEAAFALDAGDRVVGVTDYCVWPETALRLPRVGGMIDPNLERLASLAPDLLVVQGQSEQLRTFARTQGLRLAAVHMDRDLDSIFTGLAALDSLLHPTAPGRAEDLERTLRDELASIRADVVEEGRPSVLLVLGREPGTLQDLYSVGSGTFLNELIEIGGGVNAYADHPQTYFRLSLETLVAHPPDVVVELRPGEVLTESRAIEIRAPWQRNGLRATRVEIVNFDGIMIPGPRIVESARALARAIRGDS